jgi:uncharacterized membrane protein YjjB (DUF3815 family)
MAWKAFFSIVITLFFLIILYVNIRNGYFLFVSYLVAAFLIGYLVYQIAKLYQEPKKQIAHGS